MQSDPAARYRSGMLSGASFLIAAACAFCAADGPARRPPKKADKGKEAKKPPVPAKHGLNDFAWAFFRNLAAREKGNMIFSPLSIRECLSMVHAGARGRTAEEMARALHLPKIGPQRLGGVGLKVVGAIGNFWRKVRPGNPQLKVANSLWLQKQFPLRRAYVEYVRKRYGAAADRVDFVNAPRQARKTINAWVAKHTDNRIAEPIPPGAFTPRRDDYPTCFVVVNAVCFKADWASRFPKSNTKFMPFSLRRGVQTSVPMMCQTHTFPYVSGRSFQILEMPYKGQRLSMIVLLPRQRFALAAMCKALTADRLKALLAKLKGALKRVRVFLPRFDLQCSLDPEPTLQQMGMRDVFHPKKADLTGMTPARTLWLGWVCHEARVEVTERGTKAEAATVGGGFFDADDHERRQPKAIVFRADQPFLFLIRDNRTGGILFIGVVMKPKQD